MIEALFSEKSMVDIEEEPMYVNLQAGDEKRIRGRKV